MKETSGSDLYVYKEITMIKKITGALLCLVVSINTYALDAQANGQWISLGVPNYIHQGTDGRLYLNGDDQGSCGGVKPTYFRVDLNKAHSKEFYSLLLFMTAQKKPLLCAVESGCGSTQVWVSYCRGAL